MRGTHFIDVICVCSSTLDDLHFGGTLDIHQLLRWEGGHQSRRTRPPGQDIELLDNSGTWADIIDQGVGDTTGHLHWQGTPGQGDREGIGKAELDAAASEHGKAVIHLKLQVQQYKLA